VPTVDVDPVTVTRSGTASLSIELDRLLGATFTVCPWDCARIVVIGPSSPRFVHNGGGSRASAR
jgi:hypothetical protein